MNKNVVIIILILSFISLSSKAQVKKQVEVVKSYIPDIAPAEKLRLQPDMVDTVQIRPDIDYSITPSSIETSLSPRIYKPATVTYWEFNRPKRVYVKGGIGYPLASVADVYISNSNPNTNYIIGYVNHNGEYGNVKNDFNEKVSALNSQNRVGSAAGVVVANRALEGEIYYDIDTWSRSATANPTIARPIYQKISFASRYGDEFIELSKFNYNVSIGADRFFNSEGDNNTSANINAKFGRKTKSGSLIAEAKYDYIVGSNKYLNSSILLDVNYHFSLGKWSWAIGGKYYNDIVSTDECRNAGNYIYPHLNIKNTTNKSLQPFVEIDSELHRNNYGALTAINPYILEGDAMRVNSIEYLMQGGILGSLCGSKLSYKLSANYKASPNALYWTLCENETSTDCYDNYYSAETFSLQELSANVELEYRPFGALAFKAGGSLLKYFVSNSRYTALGRANATAYVGGEYSRGSMRYGVMADVKGGSTTSLEVTTLNGDVGYSGVKVATTLNLKAYAEFSLKDDIALFVEANNLTNSKLYEWMGYREYGVGVMAGVKMQF